MSVDRNAVTGLHKNEKSNVEITKWLNTNRSTVWRSVKKFQVTENTLDRPGLGRIRSICFPQLLNNTREKLRRNLCRNCRTLVTPAGVSKPPCTRCCPCNRTLCPLTLPSSPSPGFRGKSPHSKARKSGRQGALTLTL